MKNKIFLAILIVLGLAAVVGAYLNTPKDVKAAGWCDYWAWHEPDPWMCIFGSCTNPDDHDNYNHNPPMNLPCWPKLHLQDGVVDFMTTCDSSVEEPGVCIHSVFGWRSCQGYNGTVQYGYIHNFTGGYQMKSFFWTNPECARQIVRIDLRQDAVNGWP